MKTWSVTAALAAAMLAISAPAGAQTDYPTRPIRIIVGYGAGGSTDLAARTVAAHMEKTLGQPIQVENRPGGNGAVGTAAVARATPDGYTLTMTSGSILTIMPVTMDIGFNPLDLTFIGATHESLHAQLVRADAPWKTIQELVAHAKANPNSIVHATSGGFGINDVGMAQLAKAAGGFSYRTLPTSGGAEQILKLLSGDAQTEQNSAAPTLPHLRNGAVRALLILSPAWPELEKLGVPLSKDVYGFTVRNLSSLAGPPGMPEPIRAKLEAALRTAMADPGVMEQMQKIGELIGFKTGAQIRADIVEVQAEHKAIAEQLGRAVKK